LREQDTHLALVGKFAQLRKRFNHTVLVIDEIDQLSKTNPDVAASFGTFLKVILGNQGLSLTLIGIANAIDSVRDTKEEEALCKHY